MTIHMRSIAALVAAVGLGTTAMTVNAQCDIDTVLDDADKLAALDVYYDKNCMGEAADDSKVTRAVLAGIEEIKAATQQAPRKTLGNRTSDELAERRDHMLRLLALVEGSLTGKLSSMHGDWRPYAQITIDKMATARSEISDFQSTMRATYWQRNQQYGFFEEPTTGVFLIPYKGDIDEACGTAQPPTEECRRQVESAVELTRHIHLVERILDIEIRRRLEEIHGELLRMDGEWDYYFSEARSQYWWEFLANNAIYNPAPDELSRPPAGQLILFHPSAALERIDDNEMTGGSNNLVGVIELIGYNRLRWREDGRMSRWPLGLSVVAAWAPETVGDNFGYGLMLHAKNDYSIGIIRRDTGAGRETTWLLSVDLGKLFLEKSEEAREKFRRPQ